jgi:hypothetical protein
MTTRNAALEGRCPVETLILAASSFDFVIADRVGFGIEELKTISGATREEIVNVSQKLLDRGELHKMGFFYYGTKQGAEAWEKISALPEGPEK